MAIRQSALPRGVVLGSRVSFRVPCEHWLYCAECVDGWTKVGVTHQPAKRFYDLSRPAGRWRRAVACHGLWTVGILTRGAAERIETQLHRHLRASFEWLCASEYYEAPAADVLAQIEPWVATNVAVGYLHGLA